ALEFYLKRLRGFVRAELRHIKENKETERRILRAVGEGFCLLLDEGGREFDSPELARFLAEKQTSGVSRLAVVIGGPDGHDEAVCARGDFSWSLSRLTFPHELAAVLAAEALWRAFSINAGHPYHRG
ncbi:MAG TPA: 23S rRNA (pseudouridine(1915)-N(3))-methyltransferase RlmH, partial [Candidatus Moranbacteria bacterium]|nr:23S rRNA (pseudouridine(1915)-N(3))-methyltransferase RlmH [Candidatus Moranbacteria bacterium]